MSATDLTLDTDDQSVEKRRHKRRESGTSNGNGKGKGKGKGKRRINGETAQMSNNQIDEATISMFGLAQIARVLEGRIAPRPNQPGRRRKCKVLDVLLIAIAAWSLGGVRAACRHFKDKRNWRRCRKALARAVPQSVALLSKRAPSRSQVNRLLNRISEEPELEFVRDSVQQLAVTAAQFLGMFDTMATFSSPDKNNCIAADGTELKHLRHDGHYECVLATVRTGEPGERIILGADILAPKGSRSRKPEATQATDMLLQVKRILDSQSGGLFGLLYDMALHSADIDRCLSVGIIAVSKVQRTTTGNYAALNLGEHSFKLTDNTKRAMPVTALDGTPTISINDADGNTSYIKLDRIKTTRKHRAHDILIHGHWAVPSIDDVPAELRGAVAIIQHNSTPDDLAKGKPRTRALRPIPESDPYFEDVFGRRQDVESANNHLKSRLTNRRAKHRSTNRVKLDLAMYQLHTVIMALVNYHKRTHADLSGWMGKHIIDL